jgi:F0F1-type ATP synthase assembly protein I
VSRSDTPKRITEVGLDFGRYAGLGLRFVVTIALFGLFGWWLDGRFGTTPWVLVGAIFLGAVVAFISIVRAVPPARNLPLPPLTDADLADEKDRDDHHENDRST